MAERDARTKQAAGAARAEDIRQRNRVMLARGEATVGASGLEAAPGISPLEALAYDAREGELDALRAEWGAEVSADVSYAEGRMQRYQGRVAAYSANMQAGSTLLSGLGSCSRSVVSMGMGA